jgi:hypothetical protein
MYVPVLVGLVSVKDDDVDILVVDIDDDDATVLVEDAVPGVNE